MLPKLFWYGNIPVSLLLPECPRKADDARQVRNPAWLSAQLSFMGLLPIMFDTAETSSQIEPRNHGMVWDLEAGLPQLSQLGSTGEVLQRIYL